MEEELIKIRAKEIMPLTLLEIRKLRKDDLIVMILTREISFNNLREEWQQQVTSNIKDEFVLRKVNTIIGQNEEMRNVVDLQYQIMNLEKRLNTSQAEKYRMRIALENARRENYQLKNADKNQKSRIDLP